MNTKKAMMVNTTLISLLLLIVMMAGEAQGEITCTAVTTRISTNVTCDFGLDIKKIKRNFNVEFYYPDLTAQPDTPVACNFKLTGDLICREGSDVTFDRVVSDQIRFSRSSSVDKVGGQYVCHLVPSLDNTPVQPCSLTYKEIPTTSQPPPPMTTPTTTPPPSTTGSSKLVLRAKDGLQSSANTIIILTTVAVTFLVVIVLGCAVFLVIFYMRRHRLRKWWKGSTGHMELDPSWVEERTIAEPSPVDITSQHHMMDKQTPCNQRTDFYNQGRTEGVMTRDNANQDDEGSGLSTETSEVTKDKDNEAKEEKKRSSFFKRLRGSKRGKDSTRREADKDEDTSTPEEAPELPEESIPLRSQPEEDISLRTPPAATTREDALSSRPFLYSLSALPRTALPTPADYRYSPSYSQYGGYSRRY